MIRFIAVHYPQQGLFDDFVDRVRLAVATLQWSDGCHSAEFWVDSVQNIVVSTGVWQDEESRRRAFEQATRFGVDFAFDERERQDRFVLMLQDEPTASHHS